MNPSIHRRHQQITRLATGSGHDQHQIKAQTVWGIKKFVRETRGNRTVTIEADIQTRTADPLSDDLAPPSSRTTLTYALI
jgi:hypothetical protein